MEKISHPSDSQLIEAARLWTGRGTRPCPVRDDSALVDRFGVEQAAALKSKLKSLEDEFYESNARIVAANLGEMGQMAMAEFRTRHPEVPEEIAEVFAWCYTFDYR